MRKRMFTIFKRQSLILLMTVSLFILFSSGFSFDFWGLFSADGPTLVKDGKAKADIVISKDAIRRVKLAAEELRDFLKKISGAELPIVNQPGKDFENHIYLGQSEFTKKLGVTVDELKTDGFRIVAKDNWLVLIGRDDDKMARHIPPDATSRANRKKIRTRWQKFTNENWEAHNPITFKSYCKEKDLWLYGENGTMFAVYDFLESLGVRFYMPYEHGTIVPKKRTITVKSTDLTKEPAFEERHLFFCRPFMDTEGFMWYKRLKLGKPHPRWNCHSIDLITKYQKKTHPEYFAMINGKRDLDGCKGYGRPRLSSQELFDAVIKYGQKYFELYPMENYFSVVPPDSFSRMCDLDRKAGLETSERGRAGKMSDYVWGFVDRVAQKMAKSNPDKYVSALAYTTYYLPPLKIKKLSPNLSVTMCQRLIDDWNPKARERRLDIRNKWLKKITSGKFYIWDYYLYHRRHCFPGIPVIFPHLIQDDMKRLKGKCAGEFIEANKDAKGCVEYPGLNHLNYYVHSKLYWDPDLDLDQLLDEYYEKFYGPASEEMKEFYSFAEEVWMRPLSRKVSKVGGFMSKSDADRYFDILNKARKKAGDTVYGKRVQIIIDECQPMKNFFDNLDRTGKNILGLRATQKPTIDGKLDEKDWSKFRGYKMKTLVKGRAPEVGTVVKFLWAPGPKEGLVIGIECMEPEPNTVLSEYGKTRDDTDLWRDDVIEIFIETSEVSYYHFVINSKGAFLDECKDVELGQGLAWDSEVEIAASKNGKGWNLELFLPMENMKGAFPSENFPWGIHVFRSRPRSSQTELSGISPTGKRRFLELQKMGNLFIK